MQELIEAFRGIEIHFLTFTAGCGILSLSEIFETKAVMFWSNT